MKNAYKTNRNHCEQWNEEANKASLTPRHYRVQKIYRKQPEGHANTRTGH